MWIFKPLLTLILCIHVLDSKYGACVYIWLLVNIEMKLYSKRILSTKLPLPSACFFPSRGTDGQSWHFKLLSTLICLGTNSSGLRVLTRDLSPNIGTARALWWLPYCQWPPCATASLLSAPIVFLTGCNPGYARPQTPSCPSQVGINGCWVPCPPPPRLLLSPLPAQQNGVWPLRGTPSIPGPTPPLSFTLTVPLHVAGSGAARVCGPHCSCAFLPWTSCPLGSLCLKWTPVLSTCSHLTLLWRSYSKASSYRPLLPARKTARFPRTPESPGTQGSSSTFSLILLYVNVLQPS